MTGPVRDSQDITPPAAPFSPPPYGQAQAFPPLPEPTGRRPVQVVLATIGLGLIAIVQMAHGGVALFYALRSSGGLDAFALRQPLSQVLLALGVLVSMGLVIIGRDAGRLVAAAFSGVVVWGGFSFLTLVFTMLFSEYGSGWSILEMLSLAATLLAALAGIMVIGVLASRSAGEWFHHKRAARGPSPQPPPSYGVPGNV